MGGVGNRFRYFSGRQKPHIARPPKPDAAKLAEVQAALDRLRNIPELEVTFTPEAADVWDQFFAKWQESRPREELAAAITKRIDLYVLKDAMKYAALEGTLPHITAEQVIAAVAVGHYCSKGALRLLDDRQQTSDQGRCEQAILNFLSEQTKWIPRRVLQRHCARFDAWLFRRAIESLIWAGRVLEQEGKRRGQTVYRLARAEKNRHSRQ